MNDVEVSVLCTVYNHEKYLRRCLDGFINQITSFKFEVLVNDDCSQDSSVKILKEYAEKYPDIIKPVLQKENQYSKGVAINRDILYPLSKGKYVALCEGDDYWTDINKLQKQYEFMEKHSDFTMCVHNTTKHDLSGTCKDQTFNNWSDKSELIEEDVFFGWKVHTSSYFIRRDAYELPDILKGHWFGDYVNLTYQFVSGKIGYICSDMSVYNYNNPEGVTKQLKKIVNPNKILPKVLERAEYLEALNEYSDYRYNKVIKERIDEIMFETLLIKQSYIIFYSKNMSEAVSAAKVVLNDNLAQNYYDHQNILDKIKFKIKFQGFYFYPIWRMMWKYKYKN